MIIITEPRKKVGKKGPLRPISFPMILCISGWGEIDISCDGRGERQHGREREGEKPEEYIGEQEERRYFVVELSIYEAHSCVFFASPSMGTRGVRGFI